MLQHPRKMRTNATVTSSPPSLFLEKVTLIVLSSRHIVSDVTVIHYCGPPNANAQINIYYAATKFSGILRLPREDIPKELLCNIWHFKFKFYKALQARLGHRETFRDAGKVKCAQSVNIAFYYAATLYCALLNL